MTIPGWLHAMTDDKANHRGHWMCEHCLLFSASVKLRANQFDFFLNEFREMNACDDCAGKWRKQSD